MRCHYNWFIFKLNFFFLKFWIIVHKVYLFLLITAIISLLTYFSLFLIFSYRRFIWISWYVIVLSIHYWYLRLGINRCRFILILYFVFAHVYLGFCLFFVLFLVRLVRFVEGVFIYIFIHNFHKFWLNSQFLRILSCKLGLSQILILNFFNDLCWR